MKKKSKSILPYFLLSVPLLFTAIVSAFKGLTLTGNTSFWKDIRFFKPNEFDEKSRLGKGTGLKFMKEDLIRGLDKAREIAGFPFIINSGYRSPLYNERVGGVKDSEHIFGMAADIRFKGYDEYKKLKSALIKVGFKRLGFYYNNKTGYGFIHAGVSKSHPQATWHKLSNGSSFKTVSNLKELEKWIS